MGTIKNLEEQLNSLARESGRDVQGVFVDMLDYIIDFLNPTKELLHDYGEKYGSNGNERLHTMMYTYFIIMDTELAKKSWYDAFGDLFMQIHVKGNNNAQFFTPPNLCNLMAEMSLRDYNGQEPTAKTAFGRRIVINDCSGGSGRNLLAAKSIFDSKGWRQPYLVCEDIDSTCCKMSAVNLAMHGCFGEVICHDTLNEVDKVRFGYIINETMWPIPTNVPSVRPCCDEKRFFGIGVWREKRHNAENRNNKQLTLF